jgi:RimJ/RimL family protein N-acetyltransferase
MDLRPATLMGTLVRLEPLSETHLDDLEEAAFRLPGTFRWYNDPVETRDDVRAWIALALDEQARGVSLPFATVARASGRAVGSTRYMNIDRVHHRLEIGSTWLDASVRGAGHNTEAKLLQLRHAFETLGAIRVEFKTDSLNERSRAALLAIGATFEGIFRDHMIVADGRHRHSAWYSVVEGEWPTVRAHLEQRLRRQLAGVS